jgi:hypothetical protein
MLMNYFSIDTIEIVTHVVATVFVGFTFYKTIQFFNNPGTFNDNSDLDTISGSPTIKPESLTNSVESTISTNTIPLPIPDPSPLIVPDSQTLNTVTQVWDTALDGTNYVFAVIGNPVQTGLTEILNVFM